MERKDIPGSAGGGGRDESAWRGGWRDGQSPFNKSMNIVNSPTVRSRIISTLSENNYTLSGRICLPSCPRLFLPSPKAASQIAQLYFLPVLLPIVSRIARRGVTHRRNPFENDHLLSSRPILCLLLPLLARPQMRNRCLRILSLSSPIKPLKGIEQFHRMPSSNRTF